MLRTTSFRPLAVLCAVAICTLASLSAAWAQQPAQPAPPPQTAPAAPSSKDGYAIRSDVDLIVLRVSVMDARGKFVPGLTQDAFRVIENKAEQKLSVFKQEDVPVSLGLVIDNSGSMRDIRPQVNAAALTLIKSSNPQDESFVVNFNDDYYLDTVHDFTSDITELKDALDRIDSRGSTALYDAVIGSIDHLKKGARDKKVLLVISDGEDNASRRTLANAVQEAQRSDAVIYAIGLFGNDNGGAIKKARRALSQLADATGGLAFFPENVEDTESICAQIAHDIRNQYTLAYYSSDSAQDGTFRSVQVQLTPPRGAGKLTVRTRSGYYAKKSSTPQAGN